MLLAVGSRAAEGKIRVFGQVEHWLEDDAFKNIENTLTDLEAALPGFSSRLNASGAVGGRIGIFAPTKTEGVELGVSLGYIRGPEAVIDTVLFSGSDRDETTHDIETSFTRALLEVQKRLPMTRRTEFRLRAGAGMVHGKIEDHSTEIATGVFAPAFPPETLTATWTGFTAEIAPGFALTTEKVNVNLGFMYGYFPKLKENDNFFEFKWKPIGFHLGIEF